MKSFLLFLFLLVVLSTQVSAQSPPKIRVPGATAGVPSDREWIFKTNTRLQRNHRYYSEDKRYALVFQTDGNLVIYKFSAPEKYSPIWNTHTAGSYANTCRFQGDGNLVLYDAAPSAVWDSKSDAKKKKKKWYDFVGAGIDSSGSLSFETWMTMQNDGNLVIYTGTYPNGSPLWSSDTFEKN